MTRLAARVAGVLLGTGALLLAPASGQPPRVEPLVSVAVTDKKANILDCAGLAFLPDGARVAVRWERHSLGLGPSDAQLLVVGPRGEKSAPLVLPAGDYPGEPSASRVAVSRAGEILTPGKANHLLLQPVGPGPALPPVKGVELTAGSVLVKGVWLAGPADGVFVLRSMSLDKPAYQLVAVEGAPLTEGKGRTRTLLGGGERSDLVTGADLHPSGGWFAVVTFTEPGRDGRLDLWQLGEAPQKKSLPLKVHAATVSFAPDGKSVALGLTDGTVAFRSTADLSERREPVVVGRFTVAALAHHPRGPFVACGTYDHDGAANLVVVRADTGAVVRRIPADPRGVQAVCFNATGTRIATFGGSGRVARVGHPRPGRADRVNAWPASSRPG
ncbi:MAG TPA: WD40 repeat domain-containing protein [Urbifossiella sp.]|nr:WD40 repeat domain-containing protein [Urbifossiella sp.]